jgi:hypothetical protein
MSDLEHIGDGTLHASLMEMSIRGILNEDDMDEASLRASDLESLEDAIGKLRIGFPALGKYADQLEREWDTKMARNPFDPRGWGKEGKLRQLVDTTGDLVSLAYDIADKHGTFTKKLDPEKKMGETMGTNQDASRRWEQWLKSLMTGRTKLHKRVFADLIAGLKEMTPQQLDAFKDSGVVPPPPIPDTGTIGLPGSSAGPENDSTTSGKPSMNDDDEEQEDEEQEAEALRDKAPGPTNPQPGELYRRTTAKGAEKTVSITPVQDPTVPPEMIQVQNVVDGKPKGNKYAIKRSGLSALETEEPAGTEIMTIDAFNELVTNNRDDFANIAKDDDEGEKARAKVVNDLLKGKRFAENLARSLEARGLSLLVEEVRIANLDHCHDVADFKRWRLLAGM